MRCNIKKKMFEREGKSLNLKRQNNLSDLKQSDIITAPRTHTQTKKVEIIVAKLRSTDFIL